MSTITDSPINPQATPPRARSAGRIALLTLAIASLLGGATALAGGGALIAVDNSWRDGGYLTSDTAHLTTGGHAIASEGVELGGHDEDWVLGRARIRVTADGSSPVFVGVARAADAEAYLANHPVAGTANDESGESLADHHAIDPRCAGATLSGEGGGCPPRQGVPAPRPTPPRSAPSPMGGGRRIECAGLTPVDRPGTNTRRTRCRPSPTPPPTPNQAHPMPGLQGASPCSSWPSLSCWAAPPRSPAAESWSPRTTHGVTTAT